MDIKYRMFKNADKKSVRELIRQAWFIDYPFSRYNIALYEMAYLFFHLSNSNYKVVVTNESNNVIGFLFGRIRKTNPFIFMYNRFKLLFVFLLMIFTKPGRRGLSIAKDTCLMNSALKKKSNNKLCNELELFIVSSDYRKLHIGTTLIEMFEKELKIKNADHVFLYTDTYSNFSFYEKRGYERLCEIKERDSNEYYFLYRKQL